MKKVLRLLLASFIAVSFTAHAEGKLNSYYTLDIEAPASNIWDIVKHFDGLETWHPMFSDDVIISGTNNQVGAVRRLTVKDGPSFDEQLMVFDDYGRTYTYRVIDPNPLPIKNYTSTMKVMQLEPGLSTVIWSSSYENNSGGEMSDDEVIAFLNGAYQAGLEALKYALE